MKIFQSFRAEILADHNTSADREAVEKENHDIDDHRGGADCGESLLADEVSDDDGVDRVIQHLKYIAEEKRYGKSNQVTGDGAGRHVADG